MGSKDHQKTLVIKQSREDVEEIVLGVDEVLHLKIDKGIVETTTNALWWRSGGGVLRFTVILASIAGAVLLADMLSAKFFGDHIISALLGGLAGFLAVMKR